MKSLSRRALLKSAATGAAGVLTGCGGGGGGGGAATAETVASTASGDGAGLAAQVTSVAPVARPVQALAPEVGGKYRYNQPYLFQTVSARLLKSRLLEGSDLLHDTWGPSHAHVDVYTGWLWTNPGGDWIDAQGVRQGSVPWFSAPVDGASGATAVKAYSVDATSVVALLLDPPINAAPVTQGVAALSGKLDADLAGQPAIIGVHRYVDGTALTDFAVLDPINTSAEQNFDPALFDNGATDLGKLPHLGLGKWIGVSERWRLVDSRYTGDGFEPLAPGLGAIRLDMPAEPSVVDGSIVGSGGSLSGNGMIYLPEPLFGRQERIFVRYYIRLGSPYQATKAGRRHVYYTQGSPAWTTYGGKFGITPDHSTSTGGVSGSSGGGEGWQMRHAWYDCDAETGGPDERGWGAGYHLYDFYYQNPPGYNYGHGDGTREQEMWGQQGGLGGLLYAGQWYCIETELKLNSLAPPANGAAGFLPDGELRTWVDGRMAYARTGMVFRTSPIGRHVYVPDRLRPCRELGVRGLWLNWFHGGKTVATMDRTSFYTGLAWSHAYIGPMKF